MITPAKPTVDEASVRYQARTKLAELASDISSARDLNKVNEKFLLATKIRLWLKALDYSYLTSVQRQRLVYALIDLSGIYDFPAAPVLANMPRPSILIGGGGGISGAGIPAGGTTGQILTKTSNNDYAAAWSNPSVTGSGSSNYLTKWTSATGLSTSLLYDNGTSIGLGTATPSSSSILDLSSTSKGFLIPRMTTGQRDSIVSPSIGLQIYNTSTNRLNYYNGTAWTQIEIGGIPGGANTNVQYNDGGSFGGDSSFTFNETTKVLGVESIDFATAPTATDAERRLKWNNDEGTLIFQARNGNVAVPIGQEIMSLCYNDDVITLTKGTVVYISGSQGQRVKIKRAVNTGEGTSSKTFGIVAESIAVGAEGFVMVHGMIRGLNTSAYTQGATLYLGATAGTYTTTKPFAPNHVVYVGFVVRSHPSSGEIFTKIQNGYEFAEIHDYQEGTVLDKEVISYEASTNLYKPKSIVTLLGYTPENIANKGVANGYASLDSGGKVPTTQLPFTVMEYKGVWNAAFNNPSLLNGIGNTGDIYKVSVAGTVNHGAGNITYKVGDWTIYNGSIWEKAVGSGLSIDLQGVTDNGNETDNSIILKNVTDPTKQFEIQVLDNGNILFTGGENASLHCSGDIVAFSDGTGGGTGTGGGLGGGHVISKLLVPVPNPYTQREKLSFSAKFNVTDDPSNNATLIDIPTASLGVNLQAVTDAGNTTNDPIILTNVAGTKQVSVSVDTNGNILFNAGLDQNFHFSGDVVAFSSMSPPATSWWENMPYATASTVGGIKIGTGLTIDGNGVVSIGGGVVGQTNYSLTFNNSGSGAASGTTFNGSAARTISYNTIGAEPTLSKGNLTEATSSVLTITGGTNAVIGSGTTIQVAQSSGSVSGYLSSTDWTTFNNKVSGNGTINYIPKYTSTGNTIGNSQIRDDGTGVAIGGAPSAYRLDVTGNTKLNGTTRLTNGTNYVDISIDGNGNIIFTGETNKNFHFSGDVVAFSSLTPPVGTWWDSMPYATTTTVGGVKVDGTTITINGSGVISAVGGSGSGNVTGTGTSGYVTYWNGTSSITGESNLFWDATNDRLGIKQASPAYNLDVNGTGRFGSPLTIKAATPYIQWTNASDTRLGYIQHDATDLVMTADTGAIKFNVGAGIRATFDTSGNLGLGVTPSAWRNTQKVLQISNSSFTNYADVLTNVGINYYIDSSNAVKYIGNGQATNYYQLYGEHVWQTAPNNTSGAGAALTFTQAMTLDSSGRLGIGTTSPTATLQIGTGIGTFDGLAIGGAANRDIRIGQSSTNNLVLAWKYNATAASAYAVIETFGGSNNLILQGTGGNVGIGTTSTSSKLHVETSDQIVFLGRNTQASGYSSLRLYNDQNSALRALEIDYFGSTASGGERAEIFVTGAYPLAFGTSNTERMRITSGGNVLFNNWYGLSGGDMYISTNTGGTANIIFATGASAGTERMRITSGGQIKFNIYTSPAAVTGTVTGYLAFDSSGNILTAPLLSASGAAYLISQGNYANADPGNTRGPIGLSLREVYVNGYPTSYGNLVHLRGAGAGQLLIGWSGTDGEHANNYIRSKRDNDSGSWSPWATILTSANYPSFALTSGWNNTTNVNTDVHSTVGSWGSANDYIWDDVLRSDIGYRYTAGEGRNTTVSASVDYTVPAGAKMIHISTLPWTNTGYFDVYGVRADGTVMWIKRINDFNDFQNINNSYLHSGSRMFKVEGVDRFSRIRISAVKGRIHLQGIGWTNERGGGDSFNGFIHIDNIYSPNTIITSANIGSQSVNYATSSGTATSATTAVSAGELNLGSGSITTSAWAGTSGYHGYVYQGGNSRFGFSSTSGYIDVYTDGNFYAGIDLNGVNNLVLHAGNYGGYSSFSGAVSGDRIYTGYDSGQQGSVSCNNWFRSSGQSGWYNATYGGGIYMEDTTWVRTYGSKNFYCNTEIRAASKFSLDGSYTWWDRYGTYSGAIHRIAYISFDWDGNYDTYASHGIASTDLNGSFTDDISINSYSDINFRLDTNNNDGSEYVRFHLHTYASNQFAYIGYTGSVFQTYFSGTLYNTGDVIAYYSDQRLKKDIRLIDSALDKLGKINGYYYRPNEKALELSADSEDKQRLGVLAQEIAEVFPEVIEHAPFDRNEDGSSKSGENYMTVKYERLVPVLIQAIKEQQNKIEELESKLK